MKRVLISQALIAALGYVALLFFAAPNHANSYLWGSLTILLSFSMMGLGYGLIFRKKLVALGISLIVFKYAILGIIIFTLVKLDWFSSIWFAMGVASFILSAIYYAISEALREERENGGRTPPV
ncbi:hypothetical protein ACLSU7_11900 [Bdellovibrio sp. HCB185ZH]|uniref:hypothetical protein n=1 Tax=Bdellovibrio sp. HCB185ZH TaxID=3394235 RepID=UPI0039A65A83